MQVVTLGRGMGKTTRAIKECLETGATMLVGFEQMKQHLKSENPDLKVASFYDITSGKLAGMKHPELVVDNSEQVLKQLIASRPELTDSELIDLQLAKSKAEVLELLLRQFSFCADVKTSYWEG